MAIDWSNLEKDYLELGSQAAVARKYGCSSTRVKQTMKKLGIKAHYDKHGSNNPKWRGGRRKDSDGYIQAYCPNHPNRTVRNEVPEHRLVMEQILGRYLLPHEIVHHKNEVKDDNDPDNLELVIDTGTHVYKNHRKYRDVWGRFYPTQEQCDDANIKIAAMKRMPTERQQQILNFLADGLTYDEISQKLGLSVFTIKWHYFRMKSKGLLA
ncbi:HNH endonuclease [Sporomusa sp. KB1]|jgi:hypothetical protein|uniref:HNH endonuclease n=1 Tax=Sporomusa sp. KB1 TaxID=943346 RepID=UPI0011AC9D61|nr:HNH endonuclease [Sporomusa sp. KB1]TWH48516.1 Response regulator containing a CheY-like receiver domain and an HTH DNA-binding domain [Sporomusa sp. KB1]